MWTSGNEDKGEERAEDDEMNMFYERIDGWGASGLHPLGYRAKTKSSLDGVVICGAAKNHTDPNTGHYVNMRLNPVLRAKILLNGGVKKIPKRS